MTFTDFKIALRVKLGHTWKKDQMKLSRGDNSQSAYLMMAVDNKLVEIVQNNFYKPESLDLMIGKIKQALGV